MMFSPSEWSPLTTGLVAGATSLLLYKLWQSYDHLRTFKKKGIPGPSPLPIIGNMLTIFWQRKDRTFQQVFLGWQKQYGDVYGIFFPTPSIVIANKELAKDVLVKKFTHFSDRNEFPGLTDSEAMKDSLLSIKGDHWKYVRNTLSPTFSSNKLKKVCPAIEKVSRNVSVHVEKLVQSKEQVELRQLCKCVGMDIIAGVAFGLEVDSINDREDQFYKHGESMVTSAQTFSALLFAFPKLAKLLGLVGVNMFPKKDTDYLTSVLAEAIKERKKDGQKHGDFLQMLVDAQTAAEKGGDSNPEHVDSEIDFREDLKTSWARKGLNTAEMYANSLLFLFAGYETVTSVLSTTLFTLAAHPECLKKAQEEIDEKLGDKVPTYEDAMNLTYIDMCMNESMRLHLPVFVMRVCTEGIEISGTRIEKGQQVIVPASVFHHDPEVWDDPLTFNPERFTPEKKADRHPFSFMPFGLGPRNCIGMRLAQLEIRIIIAAFLKKYTPVLCEKSVYPPVLKPITALPKYGLWVRFERRKVDQ